MSEIRYVMERGSGDKKNQDFKETSVTVAGKEEKINEENSEKLDDE